MSSSCAWLPKSSVEPSMVMRRLVALNIDLNGRLALLVPDIIVELIFGYLEHSTTNVIAI